MQQLSLHWGPAGDVRVGTGPLATERILFADLDELLGGDSVQPVLLVVPSRTLRVHLLGRYLSHRISGGFAGASLGLDCRTHMGVAASLVDRVHGPQRHQGGLGPDLYGLFARRLARTEEPLARSLDHLRDGYGAVLQAVRDLIDAGFQPALADALDEALASEGRGQAAYPQIERARALIRVTAGTMLEMESHSLKRSSTLLENAAEALRDPARPPFRRVLVYGFNDATGVTTDFLLALVGAYGGTFYLDHPPDPADRSRSDSGLTFSRNFRERVTTSLPGAAIGETSGSAAPEQPPPAIQLFSALGAEAEVRETARRIRRLLEGGAAPEGIGVVVRQIEPYVTPIRVQFSRLGVPFSGDGRIGPYDPAASGVHALLQLLREGPRTPVERWLDAGHLNRDGTTRDPTARNDIRLALHTLAAGRLEEAAQIRLDGIKKRGSLRLPVRRSFEERTDEPGSYRPLQRDVTADLLAEVVGAAAETCRILDEWPDSAPARVHAERLEMLLGEALRWNVPPDEADESDEPNAPDEEAEILAEIRQTASALPEDLELDYDEFERYLARQLADFGRTPLGGSGGGVQVLDVTAARSLTFEHLFVLGLNRGVFPRQVQEDPLLPDSLRRVLGRSGFGVLPDLPVKRDGFHEERFLFAQLLAASPDVTLSWQEVDDREKNLRAISPLVERLRLSAPDEATWNDPPTAKPVVSLPVSAEDPRPAHEAAVLAGISGDRSAFGDILEVALGATGTTGAISAGGPSADSSASAAATARLEALDALDPPGGAPQTPDIGPGLHYGFVGEIDAAGDPRRRSGLYITALEGLARCPWRHFLQRVLAIERLPDPLETVPGIEPILVGQLVHDVLESVVGQGLGSAPAGWQEAVEAPGQHIDWPSENDLNALLLSKARAVVLDRNLGLPGLDRALARVAAGHVETARNEDWPDGTSRWPVIGAEIQGSFSAPDVHGGSREIRFRADRMDRTDDGVSFTDYKTGRHAPSGPASATAGERLLSSVRAGEWLQAAAYALSPTVGGGTGANNRGRYLFLNPTFDNEAGREFAVSSGQEALVDHFARAAAALLEIWDRGTLFPRLLDASGRKEPVFCSFCDVSDACLRGDSGARRRLREWVETADREGTSALPEARAAATAWYLERRPRGGRKPRGKK